MTTATQQQHNKTAEQSSAAEQIKQAEQSHTAEQSNQKEDASICIAGRTIKVKRVRVSNADAVIMASLPFIDAFDELALDTEKTQAFSKTKLFRLVAKHMNDFQALCGQLTDADRQWMQGLEPVEFFELCQFVISHSADFFLAQIVEPLEKIAQVVVKLGTRLNSGL